MAKLAKRKVNNETLKEILDRFDNGETPADLASSYGVHPTTIRRYLRLNGRKLSRVSHTSEIDLEVKQELRKVLSKFNIDNVDILISELDKRFIIDKREKDEDDAFEIIHL